MKGLWKLAAFRSDPRDTVGNKHSCMVWGWGRGRGSVLPNQRLPESSRDRKPLRVPLGEKLSPVTSDPATGRT